MTESDLVVARQEGYMRALIDRGYTWPDAYAAAIDTYQFPKREFHHHDRAYRWSGPVVGPFQGFETAAQNVTPQVWEPVLMLIPDPQLILGLAALLEAPVELPDLRVAVLP